MFTNLVKFLIKLMEDLIPFCEKIDSKLFSKKEIKKIEIIGDPSLTLNNHVHIEPSMDEILASIRRIVCEDDSECLKKYEEKLKEPEPSMDEILASMRRIIFQDDPEGLKRYEESLKKPEPTNKEILDTINGIIKEELPVKKEEVKEPSMVEILKSIENSYLKKMKLNIFQKK